MLNHVVKYWDEEKTIKYYESWKINKAYHREGGPAIIHYYENGSIYSEEYWINGVFQREDGPAFIRYNEDGSIFCEAYCVNGKLHKLDGPTYIYYNEDGGIRFEQYYLNEEEYTQEEWFNALSTKQKIDYLLKG